MLQWSHGRLTVVTAEPMMTTSSAGHASMEPRSFNRGDEAELFDYNNPEHKLQWSHGRLTVVTFNIATYSDSILFGFNGATVV